MKIAPLGKIAESYILEMASSSGHHVMILTGRIHAEHGCLPPGLPDLNDAFHLRHMQSQTARTASAVFEVLDDKKLIDVWRAANDAGGYQMRVYKPNGDLELAYMI